MKTKLALSKRKYTCTTCGLSLDRDVSDAGEASSAARPTPFMVMVRLRSGPAAW